MRDSMLDILDAVILRSMNAQDDGAGFVDEETQDEVSAVATLAEDPARLKSLQQKLQQMQPAVQLSLPHPDGGKWQSKDVLEAFLEAMFHLAESGQEGEEGEIDPDTQDEMDALLDLLDPEEFTSMLDDLGAQASESTRLSLTLMAVEMGEQPAQEPGAGNNVPGTEHPVGSDVNGWVLQQLKRDGRNGHKKGDPVWRKGRRYHYGPNPPGGRRGKRTEDAATRPLGVEKLRAAIEEIRKDPNKLQPGHLESLGAQMLQLKMGELHELKRALGFERATGVGRARKGESAKEKLRDWLLSRAKDRAPEIKKKEPRPFAKGKEGGESPPLPDQPIPAGTSREDRVKIMAERARKGQAPVHPEDARPGSEPEVKPAAEPREEGEAKKNIEVPTVRKELGAGREDFKEKIRGVLREQPHTVEELAKKFNVPHADMNKLVEEIDEEGGTEGGNLELRSGKKFFLPAKEEKPEEKPEGEAPAPESPEEETLTNAEAADIALPRAQVADGAARPPQPQAPQGGADQAVQDETPEDVPAPEAEDGGERETPPKLTFDRVLRPIIEKAKGGLTLGEILGALPKDRSGRPAYTEDELQDALNDLMKDSYIALGENAKGEDVYSLGEDASAPEEEAPAEEPEAEESDAEEHEQQAHLVRVSLAAGAQSAAALARSTGIPAQEMESVLDSLVEAGHIKKSQRKGKDFYALAEKGKEALQPGEKDHAAPEGQKPQDRQQEHPPAQEGGEATGPGSGDRPQEGGQGKEEVSPPPAGEPAPAESYADTVDYFREALAASPGLDDATRQHYEESFSAALRHMPDRALRRVVEHVSQARFHASSDGVDAALTEAKIQAIDGSEKTGGQIAGVYLQRVLSAWGEGRAAHAKDIQDRFQKGGAEREHVIDWLKAVLRSHRGGAGGFYSPDEHSVHLDGKMGGDLAGKRPLKAEDVAGIHAHELTHAIDGPNFELSRSDGWRQAFAQEIQPGDNLTAYARTMLQEGFAEFGRVLYTRPDLRGELEKDFPLCAQFFKTHGLWPK
jgi:hypothetical protein